ncbi:hypothetical protein [Methylobacterium oxalidis]|uniref:Secreted protein n=1 Tax=Methylobacterium oxalidis TaxID=944322 RepID=A0A512J252_9HYPH|nr:hypothetical protein [Methylobacterium oxalidis]GEP04048.1 hypothetical protein MOX02_20860 [Methylobacterium oxalidis]GJE34827.1 hypothetical protein LDDCCGHA_5042 [Methylobacterium oxalidis]GLS64079.1 hypothetical protein GCM10007888_24600 [Methylobacterium oxalidis]
MLPKLLLATTLLLALSVSGAAYAQPANRASDIDKPNSLITIPYTASTGRVVPRPGTLDPATTRGIEKRTKQQQEDSAIMRGICVGCI